MLSPWKPPFVLFEVIFLLITQGRRPIISEYCGQSHIMNEPDVTAKHAFLTGIACGSVVAIFVAVLRRWDLSDTQLAIGLILFVFVTLPAVLTFAVPVRPKPDPNSKDSANEDTMFLSRSLKRWGVFLAGGLVAVVLGLKLIQ